MNRFITIFFLSLFLSLKVAAQVVSSNKVNFQVTLEQATGEYTVWIIPQYNTPNDFNPNTNEIGATAQVSLEVPDTFVIKDIKDIVGIWEKNPLKLGPKEPGQQGFQGKGLAEGRAYYVIGKSSSETNYGPFKQGIPLAIFKFKGNGCLGNLNILKDESPFIKVASDLYGLGVENSFYSRSGQGGGGNQQPLEQFAGVTGNGGNCFEAKPDEFTVTAGNEPANLTVLTNDTYNLAPATIANINVLIAQNPPNGTVSVLADGKISYVPKPNFIGTDCFVYKLEDKSSALSSDTARVCIVVKAPPSSTDLSIRKIVDKTSATVNDVLTYRVIVKNLGPAEGTNIEVQDADVPNTTLVANSLTTSKGTFNKPTWLIPSLAVGDSAVLTYKVRISQVGVINTTARIVSATQKDPNLINNEIIATTQVTAILGTATEWQEKWQANLHEVVSFPNPLQMDGLTLQLFADKSIENAEVVAVANNGMRYVLGKEISLSLGENALYFPTAHLPIGSYVVLISATHYQWRGKFVKITN